MNHRSVLMTSDASATHHMLLCMLMVFSVYPVIPYQMLVGIIIGNHGSSAGSDESISCSVSISPPPDF